MKLKALLDKWKTLITRKPVWYGKTDLTIQPVFVCGEQYYEVVEVFNVPYQRGLAAADIYEEVQMRVTRDYLQLHADRELQLLSDPKSINIPEIVALNKELKDRLQWIVSPETLYKLASVVYFDKNESPYEYDYAYNIEKIKKWKQFGVDAFFLQEPIRRFIPHSELHEEGLVNYMKTAIKLENGMSENLLQHLSNISSTKDYYKITKSLLKET